MTTQEGESGLMPEGQESILCETGERYRALLERHKLALAAGRTNVWEWDAETNTISDDDHILSNMLGFAVHDGYTVSQWLSTVHPEDRDRVRARWEAIVDGVADSAEIECRVVSDDGRVWWQHSRYVVTERENGRVRRIVGASADVTERKVAEEATRASEERYRALFRRYKLASTSGRVGVWEWDAETDTISTEDVELVEMLGFDPTQRDTAAHWGEAIHPEDRDWVQAVWTALLDGPSDEEESEYRVVSDDGRVWWQHTRYIVSAREEGRARSIVGVTSDVTERKQAEEARRVSEEALRENYERYQLATRSGRVSIAEWDADTDALSPDDRTLVSVVGLDPQEPRKGREWIDLIHPADRTQVKAAWASVADGTVSSSEVEFRMVPDDGQVVWLRSRFVVKEREGDRVRRILTISIDITERKHAEEEIERLANRLLQSQDEERRRIAQELHDQTAQALVGSNMNLTVLLDTHDELDEAGRALVRESLMLDRQVLEDLRTLAYVLHPPLLDEFGLVSALGWYVDTFSKRSSIAVELLMPPNLDRLPSEVETALFRVVQESLTNIHRHAGSERASIRLARGDGHMSLEVRDQGHGLPADQQQLKGVGIASMRQRISQLGGHLDIQSSPIGTTVAVYVPLERQRRSMDSRQAL